MNCDNCEFMFSRDFVRCVIQKLSNRWEEPPDFQYGSRIDSPFTSTLEENLKIVVGSQFQNFISCLQTTIQNNPMTIATFTNFLDQNLNMLYSKFRRSIYEQLKFFVLISVSAYYFYENGYPGNYATVAANVISTIIFDLRKDGFYDDNVWRYYESAMIDVKLLQEGRSTRMTVRDWTL